MEDASLPRKRRVPSRFEIGCSEGYHHGSVKEYYCQQYFECLDLIIGTIRERFNKPRLWSPKAVGVSSIEGSNKRGVPCRTRFCFETLP